jgi:EAL domain-containing protein (putative c-di-GMP-specific phosphodiesterase class I)
VLLEGLGISLVQGFLFSRPGPPDSIELLLAAGIAQAAAA